MMPLLYEVFVNETSLVYRGENRADAFTMFCEAIMGRAVARVTLVITRRGINKPDERRYFQWDYDRSDPTGNFGTTINPSVVDMTGDQLNKMREDAREKNK